MKRFVYYILFLSLVLYVSCAQQGQPQGGPKDVDPPVVVNAEPVNYSVNFEGKKIMITFDEYLDMGNFTQELVVSPPMEEKPVVKLRNKTLIIEFEEELKDDVTYTFNFGEGIKDLNERNVLLNFEYVFSTGEKLDSLSIKGTLRNAFDLSIPEIPIVIMLYNELNDSLPLTEIPYYIGRTDKEGNFAVNNLRSDVYKLFVLKDGNNNFLYDLPNEEIAFLDSSLFIDADYFQSFLLESGKYDSSDLLPDTTALAIDTSGMSPDSISAILDSLELLKPDFNSLYVDLKMFVEDPVNQYLTEYKRDDRKMLQMVFNLPLTDSFAYKLIEPEEFGNNAFLPEFGKRRDSLTLFPADTNLAKKDTLVLALSYTVKDSVGLNITKADTVLFSFREKTNKNKPSNKEKTEKKKPALSLGTIKNNGKQNIHKDLFFTSIYPLKEIDNSFIEFFEIPDTIDVPIDLNPVKEVNHLRRALVSNDWKEDMTYKMVLYPGAFTDIYETTNDTTIIKFKTKSISDYGKLILNLEEVNDLVLIQIYKKDKIYQQRSIDSSGTYTFEYFDPATYTIKLIHDRNGNGKWDTGKYIEGRQPEKVEYVPKSINVRANWDHDISYVLGTNNEPPKAEEKEEKEGNKDSTKTSLKTNSPSRR